MDIYTTSFCLPRPVASSTDLAATSTSAFDLAPNSLSSQPPPQGRKQSHQPSLSDGAVAPSPSVGSAGTTSTADAARGHSTSSSVGSAGAPGTEATSVAGGSANGTAKDGAAGSSTGTTGSASGTTSGSAAGLPDRRASIDFNDAMQRLCVETMAAHQCIASFTPIEPTSPVVGSAVTFPTATGSRADVVAPNVAGVSPMDKSGRMYNVHLSGVYQQVMAARGHILRESPFLVSLLRYTRSHQARR